MNRSECGPGRNEAAGIFAAISAASFGPPKPGQAGMRPPREETCEAHGAYAIEVHIDGQVFSINPGGCPQCLKERQSKRMQAELAVLNIPKRFADCTFENYEVETPEQAAVLGRCKEYAENFAARHKIGASLMLCGRKGTGKNHLGTAIMKRVRADGFSVMRVKAAQYLDAFWGKSFDERESWINDLAHVDLLMFDEIGRTSNAKGAQDALFRLLDARSEAVLPTLITTNLERAGLIEVLGEAMFDRLREGGGRLLTLRWDSYRGREAGGAE